MFPLKKFLYAALVFSAAIFTSASAFTNGHLTVRIPEAKYNEYMKGQNMSLELYCAQDVRHSYPFKNNSVDMKNMHKQLEENGSIFYVHTFQPEIVNDNLFCHINNKNYTFKVGIRDYLNRGLFDDVKMVDVFSDVEADREPGLWVNQITKNYPSLILKKLINSTIKDSVVRAGPYYEVACDETKTSMPPSIFWQHSPGLWTNNGGIVTYSLKGYPSEKQYLDAFVGNTYCNRK